jgi:hypothetical protein
VSANPNNFDRFLARIHRRWVIVRAMERVGIAILVACAIAIALSSILIWRGESAMGLVGLTLAIGLVVGLIFGWLSRPTLFDAAVEIDRQLNLADLLATALSIRQSRTMVADDLDTKWSTTLIALAEARCQTITNESLALRRFGVRVWGGIGLCTAIVLTLGALSTNPLVLRAGNTPQKSGEIGFASADQTQASSNTGHSAIDPTNAQNPESAERTQMNDSDSSQVQTHSDSTHSSNIGSDQAGAGAGRTDVISPPSMQTAATGKNSTNTGTTFATGGGDVTVGGMHGDALPGIARDTTATQTPPWQSHDWPTAQKRANEQLRNQNIPDAYRDLVRDYFSR